MKNMRRAIRPVSAETLARMADKGLDISKHFTNKGKMMAPVRRVNLDLAEGMLRELDELVGELNVSRQAVIKTFVRQALDQHHLAKQAHHAI